LIIGFQDTVENVGAVFLEHSVESEVQNNSAAAAEVNKINVYYNCIDKNIPVYRYGLWCLFRRYVIDRYFAYCATLL